MLDFLLKKHHTTLGVLGILCGVSLMGYVLLFMPSYAQIPSPVGDGSCEWRLEGEECQYSGSCATVGTVYRDYVCYCNGSPQDAVIICGTEDYPPDAIDPGGCSRSDANLTCTDSNPCTVGDSCSAGSCQSGGNSPCPTNQECVVAGSSYRCIECTFDQDCSVGEQCNNGVCEPAECFWTPVGSECIYTSGNVCATTGTKRIDYECQCNGVPTGDQNVFISEFCGERPFGDDPGHADCDRNTNGNNCQDGDPCTINDSCQSASCEGGSSACSGGLECLRTGSTYRCVECLDNADCSSSEVCTNNVCEPTNCFWEVVSSTCEYGNNECATVGDRVVTEYSCSCSPDIDVLICGDQDYPTDNVIAGDCTRSTTGNLCGAGSGTCEGGLCVSNLVTYERRYRIDPTCTYTQCATSGAVQPGTGEEECIQIDGDETVVDMSLCLAANIPAPSFSCTRGSQNGQTCNDGLYCTQDDRCSGGQCSGSGNPCPSGSECQEAANTYVCLDQTGSCNTQETFEFEVRFGSNYIFRDSYSNPSSSCTHILQNSSSVSHPFPPGTFTNVGNGIFGPGESGEIWVSQSVGIQSRDPFTIIYYTNYTKDCGGVITQGCSHDEIANYTVTYCGDGVLDEGFEECDDGNEVSGDGCSSECEIEECGDGFVDADGPDDIPGNADDEECDLGDANGTAGCSIDCKLIPECGDATGETYYSFSQSDYPNILNEGSGLLCDPGNGSTRPPSELVPGSFSYNLDSGSRTRNCRAVNGGSLETDVCSAQHLYCGDDIQQDATNTPGTSGPEIPNEECDGSENCTDQCSLIPNPECGDGNVDDGEACDDGNTDNTDACRNDCTIPECGDGIVDDGEACDDGNTDNTDACRNDCTIPECGDGIVDSSEQCDDGNTDNTDACRNDCTIPECGDGIVDDGEQCDDGDLDNTDECRNNCTVPECGDGIVDGGEQCDDGDDDNTDNCRNDCTIPECGDGIVDDGEQCDDGDNDNTDECRNDCTIPKCGDGVVDEGEACDDGDTDNNDGCRNDCTVPKCGDGIKDSGEACDDGDTDDTDECRNDCTLPKCGDGVLDDGEQCDDGDDDNTDECRNNCTIPECGDGVVDEGEECDDGDDNNLDSCRNDCTTPICGDGIKDLGEACDDGDDDNTDECRNDCTVPECGDGIVDEGEQCDDGNTINSDACRNDCTTPICGDGIVDGDEQCDDGNNDDGDGCSSACLIEKPKDPVCGDPDYEPKPGECKYGYSPYPESCTPSYNPGNEPNMCEFCTDECVQGREKGPYCGDGKVTDGEFCDFNDPDRQGRGTGTPGCNQSCRPIDAEDVVCGEKDGDILYRKMENESLLTPTSAGLCAPGDRLVPGSFDYGYNPQRGQYEWTWQCENTSGTLQSEICRATHQFCGDDVFQPGKEQCEGDGQQQCSEGERCRMCACEKEPEPPVCSSKFDGKVIYSPTNDPNALKQHPDLCSVGTVTNFRYDTSLPGWRRGCSLGAFDPDYCEAYITRCGDNDVQEENGEQCDGTGTPLPPEGYVCQACKLKYQPYCGNEKVDPGEDCDDGKDGDNTDECTDECAFTYCGDGVMQKPNGDGQMEWCDDGNTLPTDGCDACELTYCGDGIEQSPNGYGEEEECDDGNDVDGDGCDSDCQVSRQCGDGVQDPGEACDDGNKKNGDGCSKHCTVEFCGDGYLDTNGGDNIIGTSDDEECEEDSDCPEDGATCSSTCGCEVPEPVCGNEKVEVGEECDDGKNGKDDDGCTDECTKTVCGDGIVQAPNGNGEYEECDDGNDDETDGCHECQQTEIIGECYALAVSDTTITIPYTLGYTCQGEGDAYIVKLFKAGQEVDQKTTPSGIFEIDDIGEYTVQCFVNNVSSDACTKQIVAGGYCEELTVSGTGGYAPYEATFSCAGIGSAYELVILNEQDALVKRVTDTKDFDYTHTFEQPGRYRGICFVDGVSNLVCNESVDYPDDTDGGTGTTGTGFPGGATTPLQTVSGIDSVGAFTRTSTEKLVEGFIKTIDRSKVERLETGASVGPSMLSLYSEIALTKNQVTTSCYNPCEQVVVVEDLCGNGRIDAGEVCDDGELNGTDESRCTLYCTKRSGGRKSSITCGNGVLDEDEECDDDNVRNGDGCDEFCNLEERGYCGDGVVDIGEECDDGTKNGRESLCSRSCDLRVFGGRGRKTIRTEVGQIPKCSAIDPPAVQVSESQSEILPFRWDIEEDSSVVEGGLSCSDPSHVGNIAKSTLTCHFTLQFSDGQEKSFTKNCFEDDLSSVTWFSDLNMHYGPIDARWGKSYVDLSQYSISSYGEFALRLDKITYDVCTSQTLVDADGVESIIYTKKTNQVYDKRVCQYNFPVTTPYFIQKGASLSSRQDDADKLARFKQFDGRTILEVSGIETLGSISFTSIFEEFTQKGYEAFAIAQEFVQSGPLANLGVGVNKVPNEELYVIDQGGFTLSTRSGETFNDGKPTTIVVRGDHKVIIEGTFVSNLFLVVPEGTVEFRNISCDQNDRVKAFVIAKSIQTSSISRESIPNYSLNSTERCVGGGLVIDGVLMGGAGTSFDVLKSQRRSTLERRFEESAGGLSAKIFEGASLRVNVDASQRTNLPPLADGLIESLRVQR